ncbi:hypothetical protein [Kordia sp.]|uniref:hypothetical protein n=1 Tax=Kordia sp. TaxID=1965332 RepID=UPI003B59432C
MKKLFLKLLLLSIIVLALLQLGNTFFKSQEGSVKTWKQFYENDKEKYDIIISGNSIAYSSFIPKVMNSKLSVSTFNLSSAAIGIEQVYFNFKETIKHNKPQLFIVEAHALDVITVNTPKRLKFNYQNIDGQKFSMNKLESVYSVFDTKSTMVEAMLPVVRNHNKWSDLEFLKKNINYTYRFNPNLGYKKLSTKGYRERIKKTMGKIPESYEITEENETYLKKIVDLCNEQNIKFLLVRAPQIKYQSNTELVNQIYNKTSKLCKNLNISYLDLNKDYEKNKFNESEFYDALHLNTTGATKATDLLSAEIHKTFTLTANENIVRSDPNYFIKNNSYKTFKKLIDTTFIPVEDVLIDQIYVKHLQDDEYSFYICFNKNSKKDRISEYKLALQFVPTKANVSKLSNKKNRKKGRISFGSLTTPLTETSDQYIRVLEQKKIDIPDFKSFIVYLYKDKEISKKKVIRNINLK